MYYARLTRHYTAAPQDFSGFWEDSSFFLTRVSKPAYNQQTYGLFSLCFSKDRGRSPASGVFEEYIPNVQRKSRNPVVANLDPEQSSITIRLRFKRALEIKLTPLLVPVSRYIQQALCSIVRNIGSNVTLCLPALLGFWS